MKCLVFFAGLLSPAIFYMSLSTFSVVSSSLGLTVVIALPLMEPLVKCGGEVDRAAG